MDPPDRHSTRSTLVRHLQDLEDQESWQSFFARYWELLYNVARQSGLSEGDAQDVVQETVIDIARAMPGFRYDPARGSFKQWLLRIAGRRIIDHLRRTYRHPPRAELASQDVDNGVVPAALVDDAIPGQVEAAWNGEWERRILAEAVARVRRQAQPKHFQVFDYCVLQEWSASRVAQLLDLSTAQVYLAKHRVSKAVKRAAREIWQEWSQGSTDARR